MLHPPRFTNQVRVSIRSGLLSSEKGHHSPCVCPLPAFFPSTPLTPLTSQESPEDLAVWSSGVAEQSASAVAAAKATYAAIKGEL